ncbi:MAG: hypothetical protein HY064_09420 [Bacteroidetes bacterium]|nr:hypothetical protein [Bacteroidota bacterium]
MKNCTPLLLFMALLPVASEAQDSLLDKQIDSMRCVLLKPRMENYIQRANLLSAEIQNTSEKDSIRHYSKQLQHATDSIIATADRIYGRKTNYSTATGMAYDYTSGKYVLAVVPYFYSSGDAPPSREKLEKISDYARTMRCFTKTKSKQLAKIEKHISELK